MNRSLKIALFAALIILTVSVLLALIISELIISRLFPQNTYRIARIGTVSVFRKSNLLPFELKANGSTHHIAPTHEFANDITTNSQGFRGPEFSLEKPAGTFRILMLGDSTTFGIGSNDNETFPALLQTKVNSSIEIINAGFASGLSPDTYYLYLKEKGLNLKPDLVFVNLFTENDITDLFENDWPQTNPAGLPLKIISKEREIDAAGRLVFRQRDWKYRLPLIRDLHIGILTLNLIEQKLPRVEKFIRWLVKAPDLLEDIPVSEKDHCLYLNDCTDRFQKQWQRLDLILSGFSKLQAESHVPIIITLMPPQFQLTALPEREEVENALNLKIPQLGEINANYPQKRLIESLTTLNLQYFDLLQGLRANLDPQIANKYVYHEDRHFTPQGNQAIAEAYLRFLQENKFLP